ncbi:MAG: RNA polymerase sigma factor [Crocinitomicaceae bacterium]
MVEKCLQHNRQAQHELYLRFSYMMKGICLRYAVNEVEAEDILQDSFIKAFGSLKSYNAQGALGGWLRRITVNTALMQYRKNKALKSLKTVNDYAEVQSTVEDGAIEQLELESLLEKIQQLPTGFRTVFNLYAVEGFTHKEIGEMLDVSEGTSKSQYSRARVFLRKMIEAEQKKLKYAK